MQLYLLFVLVCFAVFMGVIGFYSLRQSVEEHLERRTAANRPPAAVHERKRPRKAA